MNENKKPVYETPVIIELGELARGAGPPGGQKCEPVGSGASKSCGGGNTVPPATCTHGVKAASACSPNGSGFR